jgi:hypothetical protein
MKFDVIKAATKDGLVDWPGFHIKETPGLVVSFEESKEGKSYSPTAKACGMCVGSCFTSKAPAIEWCKWVWNRLPEEIKRVLEKGTNADKVHKAILDDPVASEVIRFARKLHLAAKYIKQAEMLLVGRVLGDFVELMDDQAEVAARLLKLTITSFGNTRKMVGFPLIYFRTHKAELAKFGWTLKLESDLV